MYSCVHSSNTSLLVFSLVIKVFFNTAAVNKEYNSSRTRNTIPRLSLEWHSDSSVTERAHSEHSTAVGDAIELPADGGQCDWHSWHLGTGSTEQQHLALHWLKGTGEQNVLLISLLFGLSALPVLKAIKEQISSQRERRWKGPVFWIMSKHKCEKERYL